MSRYDGFLIVNKPVGVTSFAMVGMVRRLTGVRRVGHAGTLDPLASGVLPVGVGVATRLIEYLDDEPKTYVARVAFGVATDTYDAEGVVTAERDASRVTAQDIERALASFVGDIEQTPPRYSAIKVAGRPQYAHARAGADVAATPRTVRVERITLRGFAAGVAELEVECGKGTYIRSLAHDLGERLGCGAHLAGLVRKASGGFTLDDAHTPEELASAADKGQLGELLLAPDRAVERRPAAVLGEAHARDAVHGREVLLAVRFAAELCRAYSTDGEFIGVLRLLEGDKWHARKVIMAS